jgi:hypothetical protein
MALFDGSHGSPARRSRSTIVDMPAASQTRVDLLIQTGVSVSSLLATAIACFFDFFALFIIFRMRYGALGIREIVQSFSKIFVCSGIMGVACWLGAHYTQFTVHSRFLVQLSIFAALIVGATALYLALAWIFRCREAEEVYGIALRRGRGGVVQVQGPEAGQRDGQRPICRHYSVQLLDDVLYAARSRPPPRRKLREMAIELLTRSLPVLRPKLGARVCWTGRLAGQSGVGARFVEYGGGAREALARMLSHS